MSYFIGFFVCLALGRAMQIIIPFSRQSQEITLYTSLGSPETYKIDFSTASLHLLNTIYLDASLTYPIEGDGNADQRVGLGSGSVFLKLVAERLNVKEVKVQFSRRQLLIIGEGCISEVHPPFAMTVRIGGGTQMYQISRISSVFEADGAFKSLMGKTTIPFELHMSDICWLVGVEFKGVAHQIEAKELLGCSLYEKTTKRSSSYECDLTIKEAPDMGKLLLMINPVLCMNGAIEWTHEDEHHEGGYFYLHLGMLCLLGLLLSSMRRKQKNQ